MYNPSRRLLRPAAAAVVAASALLADAAAPRPAAAGEPTLADVMAGKTAPLTLTLQQLDDEKAQWRRVRVALPADASTMNGPDAMERALSAALGGPSPSVYYTRGQVVSIDGQSFLIAYRPKSDPVNLSAPKPVKLTPKTPLTLSLLSVRTAAAFEDIRAFNLQEEMAAQRQADKQAEKVSTAASSVTLERETDAEIGLRQIGLALLMYAQDHGDVLPAMKDPKAVRASLGAYLPEEGLFLHPLTGEAFQPNPALSGRKYAHISSPESMVAFFEPSPDPEGMRAVLFLDGSVRRISGPEWRKLARVSKIDTAAAR
jgi:hypothetical protein